MRALITVGSVVAALGVLGAPLASAQVFGPPSTVWGSISDEAGTVPDGVAFEILVGETVCGKGTTQFYGDGNARVTVYYADVVSREQTPGCGFVGAEMRVKIGDRFADETARWRQGPVQLDLTFGDAQPVPIPTQTPQPRAASRSQGSAGSGTAAPAEPSAAGAAGTQASPRPGQTVLPGGLGGSQPQPSVAAADDGGGFPVWAALLLALGGVAAVGGGVGYAMSRAARNEELDSDDDGNSERYNDDAG